MLRASCVCRLVSLRERDDSRVLSACHFAGRNICLPHVIDSMGFDRVSWGLGGSYGMSSLPPTLHTNHSAPTPSSTSSLLACVVTICFVRCLSVTCLAGTAHADAVPPIIPAAGDWMVSWTRGIGVSTCETKHAAMYWYFLWHTRECVWSSYISRLKFFVLETRSCVGRG